MQRWRSYIFCVQRSQRKEATFLRGRITLLESPHFKSAAATLGGSDEIRSSDFQALALAHLTELRSQLCCLFNRSLLAVSSSMVNRGASSGCLTCKQRRVKCDESQPWCQECLRLGRSCAGYIKEPVKIRFKDDAVRKRHHSQRRTTNTTSDKDPRQPAMQSKDAQTFPSEIECVQQRGDESRSRDLQHPDHLTPPRNIGISKLPQLHQQDLAVSFFLKYVTTIGRSRQSTRGFLEFVCPVLAMESAGSALSTAVNVAAIRLWTVLRPDSVSASDSTRLHGQAVARLRKATQDSLERESDATVLACLVLQWDDTLAAIHGQHKAHGLHRDGALALLLARDHENRSSCYYGDLMSNLVHSKISRCIRDRSALDESELSWLKTRAIPKLSPSPGSQLDIIGMSITELQLFLEQPRRKRGARRFQSTRDLLALVEQVDAELETWAKALPQEWSPLRLRPAKGIEADTSSWQNSYEVYQSIQIANICNQWRLYRLILEQVKLHLTDDSASYVQQVRPLVDAICYSVPFYMGNISRPVAYSDIESPQIILPSYHDLDPTDEAFLKYQAGENHAPPMDHVRHVMIQGPMHIMSILSSLVGFFANERDMMAVPSVPNGQIRWIQAQFARSVRLMPTASRSPSNESVVDQKGISQNDSNRNAEVESTAQAMMHKLWTMTAV